MQSKILNSGLSTSYRMSHILYLVLFAIAILVSACSSTPKNAHDPQDCHHLYDQTLICVNAENKPYAIQADRQQNKKQYSAINTLQVENFDQQADGVTCCCLSPFDKVCTQPSASGIELQQLDNNNTGGFCELPSCYEPIH